MKVEEERRELIGFRRGLPIAALAAEPKADHRPHRPDRIR
jgi:hypothetical protein